MTRNGKIARLPQAVRTELNRRLRDGEPGVRLVEWLNSEDIVQRVMASEFGGRAVSGQNLSEWKQGGYLEWVRHEESCALVQVLKEQAGDLEEIADGMEVCDVVGAKLAVELARMAEALLAEATDTKERWEKLRELLPQLAALRRADHRARKLRLERARQEREDAEWERAERDRMELKAKRAATAPIVAKMFQGSLGKAFGGGERGEKIADLIAKLQEDLTGPLTGGGGSGDDAWAELEASITPMRAGYGAGRGNPTKSNRIKPKKANAGGLRTGGGTPSEPAGGTPAPRSYEAGAGGLSDPNRGGTTGGETIVGMESRTRAESLRFQPRVEGDDKAGD